jgi:hypothetical protein
MYAVENMGNHYYKFQNNISDILHFSGTIDSKGYNGTAYLLFIGLNKA